MNDTREKSAAEIVVPRALAVGSILCAAVMLIVCGVLILNPEFDFIRYFIGWLLIAGAVTYGISFFVSTAVYLDSR